MSDWNDLPAASSSSFFGEQKGRITNEDARTRPGGVKMFFIGLAVMLVVGAGYLGATEYGPTLREGWSESVTAVQDAASKVSQAAASHLTRDNTYYYTWDHENRTFHDATDQQIVDHKQWESDLKESMKENWKVMGR